MNPWRAQGREFVHHDIHLKAMAPARFRRSPLPLEPGRIFTLLGPRQVGKTTLVKSSIERLLVEGTDPAKILYLSLDRLRGRNEMHDALALVRNPRYVFLDEVSRLKGAMHEIKILSDSGRLRDATVLLTGSSPAEIRESAELAPGRGAEGGDRFLRPLSFRDMVTSEYFAHPANLNRLQIDAVVQPDRLGDILSFSSIDLDADDIEQIATKASAASPLINVLDPLLSIYLEAGGFPFSINRYLEKRLGSGRVEDDESVEIFIRDVMGDINAMGKSELTTRRLVHRILRSYGSRFSFQRLARGEEGTLGVQTVQSYLSVLERSLLFQLIHAIDPETLQIAPRKQKKVYLIDPFIHHAFTSYDDGRVLADSRSRTLTNEEKRGAMVEGLVVGHLAAHGHVPFAREVETFLAFHYDTRQREVDAVFRGRRYVIGIEIRFGRSRGRKPPHRFPGIDFMLCLTKDEFRREADCLYLPVSLFAALLPTSSACL